MPGKVMKIGTFSDWVGLFKEWREEIGVNHENFKAFQFETIYGAIETEEISFGYYKGRPKWENLRQIPTQNMRDALMNLIVYQGDTEFASVEQQRYLFETAPTDWDRSALTRDDRGDAPRLADVRFADRAFWNYRRSEEH